MKGTLNRHELEISSSSWSCLLGLKQVIEQRLLYFLAEDLPPCDIVGSLCLLRVAGTIEESNAFGQKVFLSLVFHQQMWVKTFNNATRVSSTKQWCQDDLSFSDLSALSSKACECSSPCERRDHTAVLSNSQLDLDTIKLRMVSTGKSKQVLRRKQKAMDIAAQVKKSKTFFDT